MKCRHCGKEIHHINDGFVDYWLHKDGSGMYCYEKNNNLEFFAEPEEGKK